MAILSGVCMSDFSLVWIRRLGDAGNLIDFNGDPGEAMNEGWEVRVKSVGDGVDSNSAFWPATRERDAKCGCWGDGTANISLQFHMGGPASGLTCRLFLAISFSNLLTASSSAFNQSSGLSKVGSASSSSRMASAGRFALCGNFDPPCLACRPRIASDLTSDRAQTDGAIVLTSSICCSRSLMACCVDMNDSMRSTT